MMRKAFLLMLCMRSVPAEHATDAQQLTSLAMSSQISAVGAGNCGPGTSYEEVYNRYAPTLTKTEAPEPSSIAMNCRTECNASIAIFDAQTSAISEPNGRIDWQHLSSVDSRAWQRGEGLCMFQNLIKTAVMPAALIDHE